MRIESARSLSLALAVGFACAVAAQNATAQLPHLVQGQKLIVAAQNQLSQGATDFGGHRVNAMNQLKQALDEIQAARAYYAAHPAKKPPEPVPPLPEAPPGAIKHPHLDAARNSLVQAYDELNRGDTDFGGHRVKAMEHVKQAVGEIDQARIYAQTHEQPK